MTNKCWKRAESGINLTKYIIPSKKGIFLGGDRYANHTLTIKRRGSSKYYDVFAIKIANKNKLRLPPVISEKVTRQEATKSARRYMEENC